MSIANLTSIDNPIAINDLQVVNELNFPASTGALPYSVSESRETMSVVADYSGALVQPDATRVSFYRFGDWVTVEVVNLVGFLSPLNSINPIIIAGVLPAGYRPAGTHTLWIRIMQNGGLDDGQCQIFNNGDITFGSWDNNNFFGSNHCGAFNFSVSFDINN